MCSFAVIKTISDYVLFVSCFIILLGSIYITCKSRFIQIRSIPDIFRMFASSLSKRKEESNNTILPHRALLTAMSTTLGISTIAGPVFAIYYGGPGALFGFLLTSFFGSAATYIEVSLSIQHRKKLENGVIMGGPMQFLKKIISPAYAKWYAFSCLFLMIAWSTAQANQLAAILNSPQFGSYGIPVQISGGIITVLTFITLTGGIKRLSSFSSKLVPIMFTLYLGSSLWIILSNTDKFAEIMQTMVQSALSPYSLATGTVVGGLVSALRWGIFKGVQVCEAGIGTQAIPHAMADTTSHNSQAALSMLSTYTAGIIAFLSGCVALITNTWQDPTLPLGISMVAASYEQYFSYFGTAIVAISTILFGFGTILGNTYNGTQCFAFLSENKKMKGYLIVTSLMLYVGAITEAKDVWALSDFFIAAVAVPYIGALVLYAYRTQFRAPQLSLEEVS